MGDGRTACRLALVVTPALRARKMCAAARRLAIGFRKCEHMFALAVVTITAPSPDLLDAVTDALGAQPNFTLRRLALDRLEAGIDDAADFLVRMRVEAVLARLDGTKSARVS